MEDWQPIETAPKDFDEFMPISPGNLVIPTRWRKVRRF
jgi:hypothetical protein